MCVSGMVSAPVSQGAEIPASVCNSDFKEKERESNS